MLSTLTLSPLSTQMPLLLGGPTVARKCGLPFTPRMVMSLAAISAKSLR